MEIKIYVHSSALKHGLTEEEVVHLYANAWWETPRNNDDEFLALSNYKNRDYELVVKRVGINEYLVFHCLTPPTKKFIKEVKEKGLNNGH